ncbi:acyl-CoA thioesterase domain-containing protein [Nonomuraea sp. NPDC050310]|uniref:acyl-CoA thioesterase domain-containing protein n=1 Tax=unclassified Nonomuraea TaxID=2593643 RepID=UPI0033CFE4B3
MTAFFTLKAGEFVPAPHARGPWSPEMLHGRLLGGLAARAAELEHAEPGLRAARLTVDLFRNAALLPLAVETVRVRDGRRIRVADVTISSAQGALGRASVVFLREGEQPPGHVAPTPAWAEPPPEGPAPRMGEFPPFEMWPLTEWTGTGPKRAWMRELYPLVAEEPLSPLVRAALAADFASPLANSGSAGLHFINADYTLTLSRTPSTPELGLESSGHLSADGIATGHCTLHDLHGPVGYCLVTAVANPGGGLMTRPPS